MSERTIYNDGSAERAAGKKQRNRRLIAATALVGAGIMGSADKLPVANEFMDGADKAVEVTVAATDKANELLIDALGIEDNRVDMTELNEYFKAIETPQGDTSLSNDATVIRNELGDQSTGTGG